MKMRKFQIWIIKIFLIGNNNFENLIDKISELNLDLSPIDDKTNNKKENDIDIEFISNKRNKIDKSFIKNKIEKFNNNLFLDRKPIKRRRDISSKDKNKKKRMPSRKKNIFILRIK